MTDIINEAEVDKIVKSIFKDYSLAFKRFGRSEFFHFFERREARFLRFHSARASKMKKMRKNAVICRKIHTFAAPL